jgi:nucleoside 2-deoxyribosyltransferase
MWNIRVTFYDCLSCGEYGVDRISMYFEDCGLKQKASHLAAERHLHKKTGFILAKNDDTTFTMNGEVWPYFTMETFLHQYPKDSVEIIDRTLLNFDKLSDFPGKPFVLKPIHCGEDILPERPIAFCSKWTDLLNYIFFLEREGVAEIYSGLRDKNNRVLSGAEKEFAIKEIFDQLDCLSLLILPKGLQRIRELKSKAAGDQSQAFVAMWFDPSRNKVFDVMEKAAIEAGFDKCLRIDNKETNNKICDEIIAEIRKSQCVIADFTGNRGGVYFEAGFALGLGIPVIWLVDDNWWNETDDTGKRINDLHFDTRQYAHINYKDENDLYERLKARIAATISIQK